VLLAFLHDSCAEITDEVVDLFDRCLSQVDARARRQLEEFRKGSARATNEKVKLFGELGSILLDSSIPDGEVRKAVFERVGSPEGLRAAVEESERLVRPADDNYFDFLGERYSYIRQFAPAFLDAFRFRSNQREDPLLDAVSLLRTLNAAGRRRVPEEAPLAFVPARWGPYIIGEDGRIDRRYWELCLLAMLREGLRSGDVWVEGSRRYADPQSYLIPKDRWPSLRPEFCQLSGTGPDGAEHLDGCRTKLQEELSCIWRAGASHRERVFWQADALIYPGDRSEDLPKSAVALRKEVGKRLARVELTDLLVEVDRWTNFTGRLTHAAGSEPRTPDLKVHLYASILAQATNLGPVRMAELSDLSYRKLAWATNW